MEAVFLKVLNMSLSASALILVVLLLRLILRRVPKWIHCLLFAIVGVRLILPFSLKTVLSLIPSAEPIPSNIAVMPKPAVDTGIPVVNEAINPIITERLAPEPFSSVNPLQVVQYAASILWIVGIAGMLVFLLISWLRAKRSVRAAVRDEGRTCLCDEVRTPFILGLFRPKIYLPSDITEETKQCVLLHERAHIKRGDPWWKLLAFLILSVHWFNPLCWLAYILFCRDIESACDESVIWWMPKNDVAAYSQALLDCGRRHRIVSVSPLAFGETNVKNRVRSVLRYKRPLRWAIIASVVILAIVGVCFLTNPREKTTDRKWTGDGHWYTFSVTDSSMSTLISSTNVTYYRCPDKYTAATEDGVAIGKLKGMNLEYKVYTLDPEERFIWWETDYEVKQSYYRYDIKLQVPDQKNCDYSIGDARGMLSLSNDANADLRPLLSALKTGGEKVQCKSSELTDWYYVNLLSREIPNLAYQSNTVIARYNGQVVLGLFNDLYSLDKEGTILSINRDSALCREYERWISEPEPTKEPLPVFTEIAGGITDGKTKYYDMPPHWYMIPTDDDDTWAWSIGQIEIQDDPEQPSYMEQVWTNTGTKRTIEILDPRYPNYQRILIKEYDNVPDPFKDQWMVYLLNDMKSINLKLSAAAGAELRDLYQNAQKGSMEVQTTIDESAMEYGTLILRNDKLFKALCYEFAGIRISGETIWLYMPDAGSYGIIPKETTAYTELIDIYKNNKLPQGVMVFR